MIRAHKHSVNGDPALYFLPVVAVAALGLVFRWRPTGDDFVDQAEIDRFLRAHEGVALDVSLNGIQFLHTNNTIRTINRLVGVFPPNQQSQIRTMISESLRAIVSQRLVVTTDGKRRVPAIEVLVINKAVGNLIRENKTFQIRSVLQTGSAQGMCMLDGSLTDLVKAGTISKQEALRNCEDPRRFA